MQDSEIELKLRATPEDLRRLRNVPLLSAAAAGRGVTRTLESVYYDTEDLRLRRRNVTLRVRKQGRQYIQTVKAGSAHAGGLLDRGEWEWLLASAAPDLSAIVDGAPRQRLGALAAGELRPVFMSHVRRQTRLVRHATGAAIEVALDHGEIRARGGAAQDVCEVELELKEGRRDALFDVALALTAAVPLRLESRTKAERGYALVAGDGAASVGAGVVHLDAHATVEEAMARIIRACLDHVAANEACALDGSDPEGIHQVRVALRRLRSAFSLFRACIPADAFATFAGEVKWLAGELGPARDWDVFATSLLEPVARAFAAAPGVDGGSLATLAEAVAERRAEGYAAARAALLSPRYTTLLLRLGGWVEARGWRDQPTSEERATLFAPIRDLAHGLLTKRHRKVRRRGRGLAALGSEQRHALRIACKKLRYAAEFFRSLNGSGSAKRYIKKLAALQDVLGHLNDVATARRLVARLAEDAAADRVAELQTAAGMVVGWHGRGALDLEPDLLKRWHRFTRTKPFWSRPDHLE